MNDIEKQRAIRHYRQMAAEAAAYRAEQERMNTLFAQVQVDAVINRIRRYNASGCFAPDEPKWANRLEGALRREFGAWWLAGAVAVGAFFGFGAALWLALVWGMQA